MKHSMHLKPVYRNTCVSDTNSTPRVSLFLFSFSGSRGKGEERSWERGRAVTRLSSTSLQFLTIYSRFSRDVTAAMLVYRTIANEVFWEFDFIIMQNSSDILPMFCTPTWPSHHVSETKDWSKGKPLTSTNPVSWEFHARLGKFGNEALSLAVPTIWSHSASHRERNF